MPTTATLRLTQTTAGADKYRVALEFEAPGKARKSATASFTFVLNANDQGDFRWYLENYAQFPQDPAPAIALGVEQRMAAIGVELFRAVFQASDDARPPPRATWRCPPPPRAPSASCW